MPEVSPPSSPTEAEVGFKSWDLHGSTSTPSKYSNYGLSRDVLADTASPRRAHSEARTAVTQRETPSPTLFSKLSFSSRKPSAIRSFRNGYPLPAKGYTQQAEKGSRRPLSVSVVTLVYGIILVMMLVMCLRSVVRIHTVKESGEDSQVGWTALLSRVKFQLPFLQAHSEAPQKATDPKSDAGKPKKTGFARFRQWQDPALDEPLPEEKVKILFGDFLSQPKKKSFTRYHSAKPSLAEVDEQQEKELDKEVELSVQLLTTQVEEEEEEEEMKWEEVLPPEQPQQEGEVEGELERELKKKDNAVLEFMEGMSLSRSPMTSEQREQAAKVAEATHHAAQLKEALDRHPPAHAHPHPHPSARGGRKGAGSLFSTFHNQISKPNE